MICYHVLIGQTIVFRLADGSSARQTFDSHSPDRKEVDLNLHILSIVSAVGGGGGGWK